MPLEPYFMIIQIDKNASHLDGIERWTREGFAQHSLAQNLQTIFPHTHSSLTTMRTPLLSS